MGKIDLILSEGRRLLERQLELECVRVENGNTLVPFSCPRPDPPPRLLVARYDGVNAMFFRYDLPSRVRREFEHLSNDSPDRLFADEQVVMAILIPDAPCEAVWRGMAYIAAIALGACADAVRLPDVNEIGTAVFGVILNDRVVSACSSSRENDSSAEAWVWTEPDYRGRGYARQSVAAWAHDLQERGKVPFYSHHIDNIASRKVARTLQFKQFVTTTAYT
jgi:GNAT superfamily N-acetyltransferase